ncbi:hypothetical protein F383_30196 [Gossypium arboreum]|uniref:Uncharacterized protein n=1 Tax=Gossypium arboreum TaxID=29729 RepID=A0A0B0PCV5_GOSAR|nr:hypothetical protein F383_30196 [Gossypium arboreum]
MVQRAFRENELRCENIFDSGTFGMSIIIDVKKRYVYEFGIYEMYMNIGVVIIFGYEL